MDPGFRRYDNKGIIQNRIQTATKQTVHFCGSGKNKEYLLIIFVTLIMDGEEVSTFVLQDWNAQYKNYCKTYKYAFAVFAIFLKHFTSMKLAKVEYKTTFVETLDISGCEIRWL